MPTLARLGAIKIQMFADHNPPHFHVFTALGDAIVSMADLSVMRGRIRRRDLDIVTAWAGENKSVLEKEWRRLNGRR